MKTKECNSCGIKEVDKFYPNRNNKCKLCISNAYKNREDKESYIAQQKVWRSNNLLHYRVTSAKHRAKRNNLIFELTDEIVLQKLSSQNNKCFISKQPLTFIERDWNSLSLDRLDSSIGYTIDNTIIVTKFINLAKNELSLEEFINCFKEAAKGII